MREVCSYNLRLDAQHRSLSPHPRKQVRRVSDAGGITGGPTLAPRPAARYTVTMIAALRLDEPCRQRHPLARRKPASGGLNPAPRHRFSRWRSQPTDASGKNASGYERPRRVPHLPQSGKPGPCSTAVRGLLGNKDVRNAISDAVKLGLSTPNWGGGPHSEAGFWAGRGPAGGVNVGGVYTSDQARNITVRGGDALLAGAFYDKTFFHLHLNGSGPSDPDRALADSVLFGTGANIVAFDSNGKVTGCYAGG